VAMTFQLSAEKNIFLEPMKSEKWVCWSL